MVTTYTIQSLMGFLVSPSLSDNVCNVPHRRALGLNSITSHTDHVTDARHAIIGATTYLQIIRQPRPLSPHPLSKEWCPLDTPEKV
jgi:hypothetical protein